MIERFVKAVTTGKLSTTSGNIKDSAFIYAGFSNWKDATVAFPSHEKLDTCKKAVEMVVTLPETTQDVGELLLLAYAEEKAANWQCPVTMYEGKF